MNYVLIIRLVILIGAANAVPIIGKLVLGNRFSRPLDGNAKFLDGRPLLGSSKTIRGIVLSILLTTVGAPLLGFEFRVGFLVSAMAMFGDLCSSFLKRRIGLAASSRATGLDQLPESLFPLLACQEILSITFVDIMIGSLLFFAGELLLSGVLFNLRIRDRPY